MPPRCSGDGKIYLAGENGTVVVLDNSANYEELARNDMGESILATPAIADGRLFIRTRTRLLCVSAEPSSVSFANCASVSLSGPLVRRNVGEKVDCHG